MNPCSILCRNNAFGPQDGTQVAVLQLLQSTLNPGLCKLSRCFHTPAVEDLICVMVVMPTAFARMAMAALARSVMMRVTVTALLMIRMVPMVMTAPFMIRMVPMIMTASFVIRMVPMIMATPLVAVGMCMSLLIFSQALHLHLGQLIRQSLFVLHCFDQLQTGELVPRCCHHSRHSIVLPQKRNCRIQFFLRNGIRPAENNGGGRFNLVIIKLSEITHVNLALSCIGYRHGITQLNLISRHFFHGSNDIAELSDPGRLNQNPVRVILVYNLLQSLSKIADQRATNAAGIDFPDLNACLLKKAAVDSYLTELIFNQNQLLACVGFCNHLTNQRRFPCP